MENLSTEPTSQIMSYKEWALTIFISSLPLISTPVKASRNKKFIELNAEHER